MSKRMVRVSVVVVLLVGTVVFSHRAVAADWLGWADEFIGYEVHCRTTTATGGGCTVWTEWNGASTFPYFPLTWTQIGNQGANTQGRLNAREKVMFRFVENSTQICATATATLTRFRTTSPPAVGTACGSVGTSVDTAQQIYDSCGFPVTDRLTQVRMLPVLDFSAETAGPGTTIGYRTSFTVNASSGMGGSSITYGGCYKIGWI